MGARRQDCRPHIALHVCIALHVRCSLLGDPPGTHLGQNPLAVPSVRPSAAPCIQTPSQRIAATSPCELTSLTLWPRDSSSAIVSGEKPGSRRSSSGSH